MSKKIVFIGIIGLMGIMGARGQDTVRMRLEGCLRYAMEHNLQVRNAALDQKAAEATLTGARLHFLPSVNASATQDLSRDNDTRRSGIYGINGSVTLFSGLNTLNTYRQSKVGAEQSALRVRQMENSVGMQIITAYLTILMNHEKEAYQQEVINTNRQQREEGEIKYGVGRILESDYKLLEANYIASQNELSNILLTIEDNRNTLAALMCLESDKVIEVVMRDDTMRAADFNIAPRDSIMAEARRNMPDWEISEMNVNIARYNVGIAESAFLPTVNLSAGTSYNEGTIVSDNPVTNIKGGLNTSLTVGVNIPLLNHGASLTQLKRSKIALQQAELENEQTQIDLEDKVDEMYLDMRQAHNRFRSAEALCEAYKASYEVYLVKYNEGAITTVEMLQQQDRYLSALNDYLQSKYSFLLAEKQLDIYTGKEIKL